MLVVFYRTEADEKTPTQQVCVYRQVDSKYAPVTTFNLEYKAIHGISIHENDIYIATDGLVHKYTVEDNAIVGQKSLNVGPATAIHYYNEKIFIGGADSDVFITCENFSKLSKYSFLQEEQINCITNTEDNFILSLQTKIIMLEYKDGKFINIRQYYFFVFGNINYCKFLSNGSYISSIEGHCVHVGHSSIKGYTPIVSIKTPIKKAVVVSDKEFAVSSVGATAIFIYNAFDLIEPPHCINIGTGLIIELNFLNDKFLRYTTADGKNIRYYSYNRASTNTRLIGIKPMSDNIRMS